MPITAVLFVMCIALVAAGVAMALVYGRGTMKRPAEPLCGNCRYNLTGAPGNRCPECGQLFIEAGVLVSLDAKRQRRVLALSLLLILAPILLSIPLMALDAYRRTALGLEIRALQAQRQALLLQVQALQAQRSVRVPPGQAHYSPDGLLYVNSDGTVRLWDLNDRTQIGAGIGGAPPRLGGSDLLDVDIIVFAVLSAPHKRDATALRRKRRGEFRSWVTSTTAPDRLKRR